MYFSPSTLELYPQTRQFPHICYDFKNPRTVPIKKQINLLLKKYLKLIKHTFSWKINSEYKNFMFEY